MIGKAKVFLFRLETKHLFNLLNEMLRCLWNLAMLDKVEIYNFETIKERNFGRKRNQFPLVPLLIFFTLLF